MKREGGNWTRYRSLPGVMEKDFHRAGEGGGYYEDHMAAVYHDTLDALQQAQEQGYQYVLFTHGSSTSYGWKKRTSRSVIRGLMRSSIATPFIYRARCVQHETCFVAAIRPAKVSATAADEAP
jgi:hypothetical protein